jgi:Aminotransferase class-III/Amino acid permease
VNSARTPGSGTRASVKRSAIRPINHQSRPLAKAPPAASRFQPYAYRSGRSAQEEVDYCIGQLRDAISRRATGLPPAFIIEPVQGNGTQLDFPDRYYHEVRQVCIEHDILLVFDEVQTGFGRTGKMWAAQHYGVTPDILVFGKGVGGGFAIAFSMISITTAIFFLLPSLFGTAGAAGVWLWIPCAAGVFLIVLVYAHLGARIPITGFAYQWNSRLINPHYGWFTGYTALLAFMAGTAATAVALATVFASDIWKSPTHGDIVLFATVAMAVAALINIISIRAVSAVNNTGVFFEITGSVGAAALLFFGAIFFFHHDAGFAILASTQRTSGGALWHGFVLAALLPLYCFIGWEGAADLAEETIYAYRKKRMPAHRQGDFSLGRWFVPVAVAAFVYATAVIVIALTPHQGHTAAMYLLAAEVVGVLWYLLYLRRRLTNQSAGVLRKEVVELERSAEVSASIR